MSSASERKSSVTDHASLIPPEKMVLYRQTACRRLQQRRLACKQRQADALAMVDEAAVLLKTAYGADKVVLFGSLTRKEIFDEHSDVDLAVQGLDEQVYYRVLAELMNIRPEIDIDLIRMEEASLSLLEVIQRGIVL